MTHRLALFTKQVTNGRIFTTNSVPKLFRYYEIQQALAKHLSGDWGDIDEHDKQVNAQALLDGSRIMSMYTIKDKRLWIITDNNWDVEDRSVFDTLGLLTHPVITTILRPEDY